MNAPAHIGGRISILRLATGAAVIGLLVAVAFILLAKPLFPNWVCYLWPTAIFLLATDGHEGSFDAFLITGIAVFTNGLVYAAAACFIKLILILTRRRSHPHDSTVA